MRITNFFATQEENMRANLPIGIALLSAAIRRQRSVQARIISYAVRLVLAVTFLILLTAVPAGAQITFDAAASTVSEGSTMSWSHTVGNGSNRLLVVGISENIGNPFPSVTSVTYAGQNLTRQVLNGGDDPITEIWTLLSPPSGTAMIVVTHPSTPEMVGGSVSFAGVNQTTPIRASNQARATMDAHVLAVSTNVTSNSGDVVIDTVSERGGAPSGTPGAGQMSRWSFGVGSTFGGGSTQAGAVGSTAMSWNISVIFTDTIHLALAVLSLIPAPPPPSFDTCLKDNSTGNLFQWNSTTGQYKFTRCSDGFMLTATGTVGLVNGIKTLTDFKSDRRLSAGFNTGQLTGSATIYLQVVPGVWQTFRIVDTNPAATCSCGT